MELLNDPRFVFSCNQVIRKCILRYSEQHKTCEFTEYPSDEELALVSPVISYTLLHDAILLDVRSYAMRYAAMLKREALQKLDELRRR